MNKSKIDYVFDYLNNNDFRYHMEDGTPYKELSMEERDILSTYIIELQEENKKQKEVIDKAMIELDTIINDLEKHGDEAPAPSKEELCKIFNILKEVSE